MDKYTIKSNETLADVEAKLLRRIDQLKAAGSSSTASQ